MTRSYVPNTGDLIWLTFDPPDLKSGGPRCSLAMEIAKSAFGQPAGPPDHLEVSAVSIERKRP